MVGTSAFWSDWEDLLSLLTAWPTWTARKKAETDPSQRHFLYAVQSYGQHPLFALMVVAVVVVDWVVLVMEVRILQMIMVKLEKVVAALLDIALDQYPTFSSISRELCQWQDTFLP